MGIGATAHISCKPKGHVAHVIRRTLISGTVLTVDGSRRKRLPIHVSSPGRHLPSYAGLLATGFGLDHEVGP